MKNIVGLRLKKLRQEKGLSQENIAEELGLSSSSSYAKIERGITDPSVSRLFELAKILKVDITAFFEQEPAPSFKDRRESYGNITAEEAEKLRGLIQELLLEIEKLRAELGATKIKKGKREK